MSVNSVEMEAGVFSGDTRRIAAADVHVSQGNAPSRKGGTGPDNQGKDFNGEQNPGF